ncbi:unnamed protein product [Somion occarium]|uniref:C2H2-type domain-containing protein n=1 Tax=Somion occarium TaxID=3059160 RepID=A0ABP1DVP4_9APHY
MASGTQDVSSETSSSLLSLSIAAASAARIPVSGESPANPTVAPSSFNAPSQLSTSGLGNSLTASKLHAPPKHRRMSSTGIMKRRLSDAREAAARPSLVTIQTAAAALSSLATLSLSSSPPPAGPAQLSTSFAAASDALRPNSTEVTSSVDLSVKQEDVDRQVSHDSSGAGKGELSVGGIIIKNGTGKKRGTIFQCESCSKMYRHPSCLIKHRWEHSPHWREASKFLLSKHQQVQLLEAAAILSHISPSASGGTSLPEDRSLWPSFLSGGTMPPPSSATVSANATVRQSTRASSLEVRPAFPTSSSVPANSSASPMTRATSTGPRVVAVPTGSDVQAVDSEQTFSARAVPVPLPVNNHVYREQSAYSLASGTSESWGSPISYPQANSYGTSAWSLPRSSIRSGSDSASRSRSGSIPPSEYDVEFVDVDGGDIPSQSYGFISRGRTSATREEWKGDAEKDKTNDEWDGMEMEMEM